MHLRALSLRLGGTVDETPAPGLLVRRHLRVEGPLDAAAARRLRQALEALPGLVQAQVDARRRRVMVRYDLARTGLAEVEACLRQAGHPPLPGRWWRLRRQWYRYLDENLRANAGAPGGACCSNPSDVYARRRRDK